VGVLALGVTFKIERVYQLARRGFFVTCWLVVRVIFRYIDKLLTKFWQEIRIQAACLEGFGPKDAGLL